MTLSLNVPDDFQWRRQPSHSKGNKSSSEDEEEIKKPKAKKQKLNITIDEKKVKESLTKVKNFDTLSSSYKELDTFDECERLVAAFPDSSKAWLLYITYHLKQAEVDKARNIAEKALKTIAYRKDTEKYDIWIALLNLENLYGTRQSLLQVFDRALTFNDHKSLYNHLADLYIKFQKTEEAEEILEEMVEKFKHDKDIWIKFIALQMKNGKPECAKKLMERSFKCIAKKFHADIMESTAQLEYQFGDLGQSKVLYEKIIQEFPKRKDILSNYISILNQIGDEAEVQRLSTLLKKK